MPRRPTQSWRDLERVRSAPPYGPANPPATHVDAATCREASRGGCSTRCSGAAGAESAKVVRLPLVDAISSSISHASSLASQHAASYARACFPIRPAVPVRCIVVWWSTCMRVSTPDLCASSGAKSQVCCGRRYCSSANRGHQLRVAVSSGPLGYTMVTRSPGQSEHAD